MIGVRSCPAVLLLLMSAFPLYAQPTMPREDIPKDMPARVKVEVENLYAPDVADRARAAAALARMGPQAGPAVPYLVTMLAEKDDAGLKVIDALARIGEPAVLPLVDAMKSGDADRRMAAAQALGKIGKPAVAPLIAALPNDVEAVRTDLAGTLVLVGKPAVDLLIPAIMNENVHIRWGCSVALGEIGDPRAVEPLIAGLRDKDWVDRWCTARALGQIGDPRAVQPLIDVITTSAQGSWDSLSAAQALRKFSDPAVPELLTGLKSENPDVRKTVVGALGGCTTRPAVQAVVAALGDPDPGVRAEAAAAAVKMNGKAAGELLDKAAKGDVVVRTGAIKALGELKETRAVKPLVNALADQVPEIRVAAATSLGLIGDRKAAKPLVKLLADADASVVSASIQALGQLKDTKTVPDLIDLLKTGDEKTQEAAAKALVAITGRLFEQNTYDVWHEWWVKEGSKP